MAKKFKQDEQRVCCICGQVFTGWGNNPFPIDLRYGTVCCDECNETKVIPARIQMLKNKVKKEHGA